MKKQKQEAHKHAFELPDGQHCVPTLGEPTDGFTKVGGEIRVSPARTDWVNRIDAQRKGVDHLMETVAAYAATQYADLAAEQQRWWRAVIRDLGLTDRPEIKRLVWNGYAVILKPELKAEEKGNA